MSSVTGPSDLQFDRADFADAGAAASTCGRCQRPIRGTYFEVNGQVTCTSCRQELANAHGVSAGWPGVLKAIGAGLAAGVAGALLYYAVLALTGYEIGLIAVAVGFLVGGAVRWGSGGRGGAIFQALAVGITYVAIVSTYVPFMFSAVNETPTAATATEAGTATEPATVPATGAASGTETAPATPGASSASSASEAQTPDASTGPIVEPPVSAGAMVFSLVILAGIILAMPFLLGFQNAIGWLIIGFALFEAWKINRRVPLQVAGPFRVGAGAPPPPPLPADAAVS